MKFPSAWRFLLSVSAVNPVYVLLTVAL